MNAFFEEVLFIRKYIFFTYLLSYEIEKYPDGFTVYGRLADCEGTEGCALHG